MLAGDLVAEQFSIGYALSILIFGGIIAAIAFAHYVLKVNAVLTFWLAYIMTRPLGASIGDEMSAEQPQVRRPGARDDRDELRLPGLHPGPRRLPEHHEARPDATGAGPRRVRARLMLASITQTITDSVVAHGVVGVFLLMAIDALLPVGGELIMVVAGAIAAGTFAGSPTLFASTLSPGLETYVVLSVAGILGSLLGALVGWAIGERVGRETARAPRPPRPSRLGADRPRGALVRALRRVGGVHRPPHAAGALVHLDPWRACSASRWAATCSLPTIASAIWCFVLRRPGLGAGCELRLGRPGDACPRGPDRPGRSSCSGSSSCAGPDRCEG